MIEDIANELESRGFTYLDIDSKKLSDEVIYLLSKRGFFNELYDEMVRIQEVKDGIIDAK